MTFGNEPFGEEQFGGADTTDTDVFLSNHRNPPKDGTPRDLALNQRQDVFFAANGDLAVVNGRDNVKQSAAIDVLHTVDPNIGATVKPTTINRIQSSIRTVLEQDPQIEGVVSVEPTSYDTENEQLHFGVTTTANDEYRIPIQSMSQVYTHDSDVEDEVRYALANEKRY